MCITIEYPVLLIFRMPAAAPPPVEAGPPRTELEELQIKANQVTDDVSSQNHFQNISQKPILFIHNVFPLLFL